MADGAVGPHGDDLRGRDKAVEVLAQEEGSVGVQPEGEGEEEGGEDAGGEGGKGREEGRGGGWRERPLECRQPMSSND